MVCGLIPLDKNPDLRAIGVGEILHKTAAKVIVSILKEHITRSDTCKSVLEKKQTSEQLLKLHRC